MTLAVVGLGLVSPLGRTPAEHTFFARIGGVRPRGSPYRTADGAPFDVAFVPWLGARAPLAERWLRLAEDAARDALAPIEDTPARKALHALVCAPGDLDAPLRSLVSALAPAEVARFSGAAGTFAALVDATARIRSNRAAAVLVVAADSLVDPALLAERAAAPRSPWAQVPLRPGEGAAALLVTDPARARSAGWTELGRVLGAAVAPGESNDDNDAVADGAALTTVLRSLPMGSPARAVYGQVNTDDLRRDEWACAVARCTDGFDMEHESVTLEEHTGETGCAAGASALVFGLAAAHHGATRAAETARAPFVAWALSRDGLRGAALAQGGSP